MLEEKTKQEEEAKEEQEQYKEYIHAFSGYNSGNIDPTYLATVLGSMTLDPNIQGQLDDNHTNALADLLLNLQQNQAYAQH